MNKWSDQITLISYAEGTQDADGFPIQGEPIRTTVFCNLQSVKATEFFQAAENGVNVVYTAVLHDFEYDGQRLAEVNGQVFAVYRTYVRQDKETVELTLAENVR